jgi:hypothetical protein
MSVHVASVSPEAKTEIRSRITEGVLTYVAKVKLLVAFATSVEWQELYIGYLALSAVGNERGYLTLFDCNDYAMLMCHELYYKFSASYTKLSSSVYAFASDMCSLGFQFLIESEGKDMEKLISKASPSKPGLLRNWFRKRSGSSEGAVVSMPQQSEMETGMRWDPEKGWQVVGSIGDLPEEHKQFMLEQAGGQDPE